MGIARQELAVRGELDLVKHLAEAEVPLAAVRAELVSLEYLPQLSSDAE